MTSGARTAITAEYFDSPAASDSLTPARKSAVKGKPQQVGWDGPDVIRYFVPDLWPEPVDTAAILGEALSVIRAHVSIPEHEALVTALWALHTHALDAFEITPRLVITSAQPASGKTSLLAALNCLVARPLDLCAGNMKGILDCLGYRPTLLIDDAPGLLRGNGGSATIIRNGRQRTGARLVSYSSEAGPTTTCLFTPIAAAVEGKPPAVFSGRSIEIRVERLPRGQVFRRQLVEDANRGVLAQKFARWAADRTALFRDWQWPEDAYQDENWMPLVAIAGDAGPDWERKALAAMDQLRANAGATSLEILLADIRDLLNDAAAGSITLTIANEKTVTDKGRIRSADLARLLAGLDGRPWCEWGKTGRPITAHKIANLLMQANVRPLTLRFHSGDGSAFYDKGYLCDQFAGAFARYLASPAPDRIALCAEGPKPHLIQAQNGTTI